MQKKAIVQFTAEDLITLAKQRVTLGGQDAFQGGGHVDYVDTDGGGPMTMSPTAYIEVTLPLAVERLDETAKRA